MAKKAYIGVGDKARKIKNGYIGIDNVARKVKKAYIGIGGVARPCWGSDPIEYYGEITPLETAMRNHVGVSAGNYAIFAGGATSKAYRVNAYDSSLTRTVAPNMNTSRFDFAGAYIAENGYTIFAGGLDDDDVVIAEVDAYDASLTQISSSDMKTPRERLASATVGKYAVFAGGYDAAEDNSNEVEFFYAGTSSITRSSASSLNKLQHSTGDIVGGENGAYAIFYEWYSSNNDIDAYNSSMTRTNITGVGFDRELRSIARAGNHAIVAGGRVTSTSYADMNIAVDTSLTVTHVDDIQEARYSMKSTSLGEYAVFTGGYNGTANSAKVDLYDSSLVHTVAADLGGGRRYHATAAVGNYALVAGGQRTDGTSSAYTNTIEAYVLNEQ